MFGSIHFLGKLTIVKIVLIQKHLTQKLLNAEYSYKPIKKCKCFNTLFSSVNINKNIIKYQVTQSNFCFAILKHMKTSKITLI